MNKKFTIQEIKEELLKFGYYLITNKYINNKQKLTMFDKYGYFYSTNINRVKSGKVPEKFHINNPYTIQNIKLWCKLNNKNFELINKEYLNASKKMLWKCLNNDCNETFDMSWNCIYSQNQGCPFCSNRRACLSNCLATKNPDLALEWNSIKNGDLTPYDVTNNSAKKVWWKCSINSKHEWKSVINNRANGNGCPYCTHMHLPSEDYNLLFNNPELCKEWNYNKNNKNPQEYTPCANERVWWQCKKCNYEWRARIADRKNGRGCPKCKESKGEKEIRKYFQEHHILFLAQYKIKECKYKNELSFDFAIFEDKEKNRLKMLIEYDGEFHYKVARYSKDKNKMLEKLKSQQRNDNIKDSYCKTENIKLLRIPYWEFNNIEQILDVLFIKNIKTS